MIRLSQEYEAITDKGLTTPSATDHMMQLKDFMERAVKKTLPEMEQSVFYAKDRLIFLVWCGISWNITVESSNMF